MEFFGAIAQASPTLTIELRKLAYIALVRSHLENCSAVFAVASSTQLKKLDVIQTIAARIITGAHRTAHSAPLLQTLKLGSMDKRHTQHVSSLVTSILTGNSHPLMQELFHSLPDGTISNGRKSRIGMGKKRFSSFAPEIFNCSMKA